MQLQYMEKFKSKSGNALNSYVVFETDTTFEHQHSNTNRYLSNVFEEKTVLARKET